MKIELASELDASKFWQDVRTALGRSLPTDIEVADWTLRMRPFEEDDEDDDEVELGGGADWGVEADPTAEFITIIVPADGVGDLTPSATAKLIVSLVHEATDSSEEDDDDEADEDLPDDDADLDDDK